MPYACAILVPRSFFFFNQLVSVFYLIEIFFDLCGHTGASGSSARLKAPEVEMATGQNGSVFPLVFPTHVSVSQPLMLLFERLSFI